MAFSPASAQGAGLFQKTSPAHNDNLTAPAHCAAVESQHPPRSLKSPGQYRIGANNLEANRVLKRMDDKAYKTAVARMNDEADRLKNEITNLRLKLRGEAEKKQWVDWVKHFGQEVDSKKALTDEQRKLYLTGLIEKIEVKFNPTSRDHELDIHFHHPIVGDGIKWKDPKKKTLGYKVLNGSKTSSLRIEKRDNREK